MYLQNGILCNLKKRKLCALICNSCQNNKEKKEDTRQYVKYAASLL